MDSAGVGGADEILDYLRGISCIHTVSGFRPCGSTIKLGNRVGLTIRQPGYPTKNAVKNWHRDYEQSLDLPAGYVRVPKSSQAQKEWAVEDYLKHGRSLSHTVKALGYPGWSLVDAGHPGDLPLPLAQRQERLDGVCLFACLALSTACVHNSVQNVEGNAV